MILDTVYNSKNKIFSLIINHFNLIVKIKVVEILNNNYAQGHLCGTSFLGVFKRVRLKTVSARLIGYIACQS